MRGGVPRSVGGDQSNLTLVSVISFTLIPIGGPGGTERYYHTIIQYNVTLPAIISCIVLTNGVPIPLLTVTVYVPLSSDVNVLIDNVPVILSTVNLPPLVIGLLSGPVQVTVGVGLPLILVNKDIVTELSDWMNIRSGPIGIASGGTERGRE